MFPIEDEATGINLCNETHCQQGIPCPHQTSNIKDRSQRMTREKKRSRETKTVHKADIKMWNEQIYYLSEKKTKNYKKGTCDLKTCSWN